MCEFIGFSDEICVNFWLNFAIYKDCGENAA